MKKKLTPEDIDALCLVPSFMRERGTTLTFCALPLSNGCTVYGTSNVIDPANFDEELGKQVALNNAKGKIWELEGYAIKRAQKDLVERAAAAAHEANRVYCLHVLGDASQPAWDDAPGWQKDSAKLGVKAVMANPDQTPEQSHASWLQHKRDTGWVYGPVKDPDVKEHPCMVPYDQLPVGQRVKDALFIATVKAVIG